MPKLIAIDMDGTLLNSEHVISVENKSAIEDAISQGHIVMICTGRTQNNIRDFLAERGLALPYAACNGAYVVADNKLVHSYAIEPTHATDTYKLLEQQNHPFKIYTNKGVFSSQGFLENAVKEFKSADNPAMGSGVSLEHFIEFHKNNIDTPVESIEQLLEDDSIEIYKYFTFTPHQDRKQNLLVELEKLNGIKLTSSFPTNVEINSLDGHKGNGIAKMAEHFNIPIEDTVAIGDNFNDLPMLEVAGLSVAMENGDEEIKNLCDVVTKTNDEHGVAYAIRKYVLGEGI